MSRCRMIFRPLPVGVPLPDGFTVVAASRVPMPDHCDNTIAERVMRRS